MTEIQLQAPRKWQIMNCAYYRECNLVDLTFSQECTPLTHQSVLETSWNIGIHQLVLQSFQSHLPRGKQHAHLGC